MFVSTCSDVAPASEPSAEEVVKQPKSSSLQEERPQEPRSLLIRLLTEGWAGTGPTRTGPVKNESEQHALNNGGKFVVFQALPSSLILI